MSDSDSLSDLMVRIRNGHQAGHVKVSMPSSKIKLAVCKVLSDEGYIESYSVIDRGAFKTLEIELKYYRGKSVIEECYRISTPGRRSYSPASKIPKINGGLGIVIVSTSKGVMTDREAREKKVGGELIGAIF